MADWDIYPDGNQACGTVTCYSDTIAPIAAVMPVDVGEIGPVNGSQAGAVTLLNWMDARSPEGSYYAWAWDTWSDLIASYGGTPDSPWGTAYKSLISATAAPTNTAAPSISGTAQVGDTLTANTGGWTNSPTSYAYTWKRCAGSTCFNISGATSSNYTLRAAQAGATIEVVVIATNTVGASAPATSGTTSAVLPAVPVNTVLPSIGGTAQVGDTLTASAGSWSNNPTRYSYTWEACSGSTCAGISGAGTGDAYTLQAAQAGDTIEVAVTATNAGGTGTPATSAATSTVLSATAVPVNNVLPVITGTAQEGQTLSASAGSWSGSPTSYGYQWQDCSGSTCTSVVGATGSAYTLGSTDVGASVVVQVTATNSVGSATARSAATVVVTSSGGTGGLDGLHVVGTELQDAGGASVVLHGVDQSGTEYQCANGYGIFDNGASSVVGSASDASDLSVMPSWGINSVFIGLNEDCWLGINGSGIANWSSDSGQDYVNAIKAAVSAAEGDGLYPVIGFYWGDPGSEVSNGSDPNGGGQPALPDADHAPLFWEEVANTFKDDPNVIFRLQEEPHPSATGAFGAGANTDGNAGTSLYNWQCWAHGSVQFSTGSVVAPYDTAPTPVSSNDNCDEYATNATTLYQTVGMQSLINIIRGTGADNVIQVPMLGYANVSDCNYPTQAPAACGFLDSADGVKVSDPIAGTDPAGSQLMADWDIYPDGNQACGTVTCYSDTIAPIAAVMPVDVGEIGPVNGSQAGAVTLLNWMDARSPEGSYYAWAWDTWSDLIASYGGTPDSPWGTAYQSLLLSSG